VRVTTQFIITMIAAGPAERRPHGEETAASDRFWRLPIRRFYHAHQHTVALVAIQILDGVEQEYSLVSVLVIADLTRGSGRFNIT